MRADRLLLTRRYRHLAGSIFCAVLVLGVSACQSDDEKIQEFMARGEAYSEDEGTLNESTIEFRNVLKIDPNNAVAHHELAKAYLRLGKLREGFWELNETVRLDPSNTEARLSFGQMSLAARDWEESLAQAQAVVDIAPDNPRAIVLKAQALEALERVDEAEALYLQALEIAVEDEPNLLHVVAAYYKRRQNREAAEPYLLRFIQAKPGFSSYTAMAHFTVADPERDEETEQHFRDAAANAEEDQRPTAYRNLAGYLFGRGDVEEAISVLEEGIEVLDEKLDLIYLLARFYQGQGDSEKADELMSSAAAAQPDDPQPLLVLSAFRGRLGDSEGALAAAEKAITLDPTNQQARLRKAELLVDLGVRKERENGVKEGREIVLAVLEEEPSSPDALFVQSKIQLAENDHEAAIASLRSAIDGRPDWPQAHFVLGSALAVKGDNSGARVELARAVELDPQLNEARRLLARIHSRLGEHEYAIEQGRVYLRARPDDATTRILVSQSLVRIGKLDEAHEELSAIPDERLDASGFFAIGRVHMARGELNRAHSYLLRAEALEPHTAEILSSLLRLDVALGKVDDSVQRIATAAEARPESAPIAQLQGEVAMLAGDRAVAEKAFVRATELDPENLGAYTRLATFYRSTGRTQETIRTYERALESRPDSAQMHFLAATLYEFDGQIENAMKHYEGAIELDETLGEPRNNLAYLLADREETLDRALDLAQEAKALMPDSANAADTLGWVLYKRGIARAAVGYLREAEAGMKTEDPTIGIVRHHLAQAYEANGETDKALESLDRALGGALGTPEPGWVSEARAMRERLKSAG